MRKRSRVVGFLAVLATAISCQSEPLSESPPSQPAGQATQALTTDMCTDHASGTVFVPSWQTIWPATVSPSADLEAKVQNNSAVTQWVHVDVRAAYQGREHSMPVWIGSLAPGALQSFNVRFQDIPIRSNAGPVRAELVVTGDDGEHYDVKIASSSLYVQFAGNSYTVFGEEEPTTPVLSNPASFEEAANQIGTHLEQLTSDVDNGEFLHQPPQGGGPIWSPLWDLPRPGPGGFTIGAEVTISPNDLVRLSDFLPWSTDPEFTNPTNPLNPSVQVCATWPIGGWADQLLPGPPYEPASYAKAFVRGVFVTPYPPGTDTWSGFLDANGCTPYLKLSGSTSYQFGLVTELGNAGGPTVKIQDKPVPPTEIGVILRATQFKTGSLAPGPTTYHLGEIGKPRHATRAAAVASTVLRRQGARIPSSSYTIYANYNAGCTGNAPACAGQSTLYLGPNPDGTHNSQWRYVVAHEFGHVVQFQANAMPPKPVNTYGAAESAPFCGCEHVDDPNDKQHCIQSREFRPPAASEGFGHYFATLVYGGGNFVYYKAFLDDSETKHAPPVALTATDPVRWLDAHCSQAERGVEWDWLTFQYGLSIAGAPTRLDDLLDIYRRACGGTCTAPPAGLDASFSFGTLRTAAEAKYGSSDPRAIDFLVLGTAHGVDH